MFFLLPALPAFLTTLGEIATTIVIARIANDAYDAVVKQKNADDED